MAEEMTHEEYIKRRDEILEQAHLYGASKGMTGWTKQKCMKAIDQLVLGIIENLIELMGEAELRIIDSEKEGEFKDGLSAGWTHHRRLAVAQRQIVSGGEE
jgi:hypothetical protein